MNFIPQQATLLFPFASPPPQVLMETFFLRKIERHNGISTEPQAGVLYYPVVRKLMMKRLHNSLAVADARIKYEGKLTELSQSLMSIAPAMEFDAVVCVPSSDPKSLFPYRDAFQQLNPSAVDLSKYFSRPPATSSTDNITPENRLSATKFVPPVDVAPVRRVLIVDDVLDTGVSAAAVAIAIKRKWAAVTTFGFTCAVWMT
jgi:predicted amidophosphoribosyltransferase